MARWVLAVLLANVIGCSGSGGDEAVRKTCSDVCASVFTCAAQLGYDLTQNGITRSGCLADCEGGECGSAVNACIVTLACPETIDLYGVALRECGDAHACTVGLPVPIGACDMAASAGECVEHLGNVDPDYSRSYCTMAAGGTWVPTCPVPGRAASCFVFADAYGGGSRQVYYASYPGDLAAAEAACDGIPWGGVWNTY